MKGEAFAFDPNSIPESIGRATEYAQLLAQKGFAELATRYEAYFHSPLTQDKILGIGAGTILMWLAIESAFDKERAPRRLSALATIGTGLAAAQQFYIDSPVSGWEMAIESALYGLATVRGFGDTGKKKFSDSDED